MELVQGLYPKDPVDPVYEFRGGIGGGCLNPSIFDCQQLTLFQVPSYQARQSQGTCLVFKHDDIGLY